MTEKIILVYDPACPYCRFIGKLVKILDITQKLSYYPIRSKEASSILHEFFEIIPYNFHFIYNDKDLCYTGLKAIPMLLFELIKGIFWPYCCKEPIKSISNIKLLFNKSIV